MTTKKRSRTETVVPVAAPSVTALVNSRLTGHFELDDFGYDRELASLVAPLASLRWSVDIDGGDLVPKGPALVVFSQRVGLSEPWIVRSVFRDLGRELRPVGVPDRQPLASLLSRAGWIPSTAADVRSVMRAGSLAGVGLSRSPYRPRRPGAAAGRDCGRARPRPANQPASPTGRRRRSTGSNRRGRAAMRAVDGRARRPGEARGRDRGTRTARSTARTVRPAG